MCAPGRTETVGTWLRSVSFGVDRRHFVAPSRTAAMSPLCQKETLAR